ncbi:YczE/YyaS/YitT family protein [Paenibacillus abyssi]|uniref:Membrane protein n=1 Tax=Paenibacillus abyssi TaxID=1340531 RepID=A0A917FQE3_9BACL|nr:YitT family protein [Paenibacillus abyssi]GGF97481.1 membrane protein [Paenibacillus abyssi]
MRHLFSFVFFMVGVFIISVGSSLMIQAELGLPPWDVLHMGLTGTYGLTFGIWSQIMGLLLIALTMLITRKRPGIGTVLNMFFLGFWIDRIMEWDIIPQFYSFPLSLVEFMLGVMLTGFGIGMYLASGLGAGPRDGFTLACVQLFRARFGIVRTVTELVVLGGGTLLGGPVFIGTVLFSLTIGFFCDRFIPFWKIRHDRIYDKFFAAKKVDLGV